MLAPTQDARVIAWLIERLAGVGPSELPEGWELVELVRGPFDGLRMPVPPLDVAHPAEITLPTTPCDRPGGPCYANYELGTDKTARFVGIAVLPFLLADEEPMSTTDKMNRTQKIESAKAGAAKLLSSLLDDLCQVGRFANREIKLRSVDGVVQAEVVSTEQHRWDIPSRAE